MNALAATQTAPAWSIFKQAPGAKDICEGLWKVPREWSLTLLQDKSPKRAGWQTEPFLDHQYIASSIWYGEEKESKKGKIYRAFHSGYGLRTGDASNGILAIDVDGSSAQPILDAISGNDLPKTVSFTSGKPGRYQLLFQIPEELRPLLHEFNRSVLTEYGDLQTARDEEGKPYEMLEFRYNRAQSCLPPSRHPTTGSYKWINAPDETPVAPAPQWLCELLLKFVAKPEHVEQPLTNRVKRDRTVERSAPQKESRGFEGRSGNKLVDFLDFEVLSKLTPEQIYNWSGHNFQAFGSTLKGVPPWRNSASGTSFHVWWDGQRWAWQDKALGCGGGAVQYRWKLKGGEGTPKGKDYVDIVRELAAEAGVTFPEFKSVKKPEHKKTSEEIQQEKEQDAAQLAVEMNIYNQLTSLDLGKIKELGIKVNLIDKPLLTPEDLNLEKHKITVLISPKGTGKTEATANTVSQFNAIYSWHDRISLARSMATKISALYKDDADKYRSHKVTFCANSGYQFEPKKLANNGILIVDEADQIFKYFFDSLCNKDGIRPLILSNHVAHLASALVDGSALYMSADITYKEIAYIKSIAPHNTEIEVVINRHKPVLSEIQFITDKSPEGLVVKLLEALENGIPCFVVDDLKNGVLGCKSIAEYVRNSHPEWADEIKEINADTVGEESMKDFLPNINERSKTVRLIICSPSVTSGVSITNGRFVDGVFGFFNGILTNTSASQAIARVRGAKDIYIWAAERGLTSEISGAITPEEVNAYYQNNYDVRNKILATAKVEYNPISEEWESPHWDLFCKNAAAKNIVMLRLRYWIRQQLVADGYRINEIELGEDETVLDYLKQGWGNIQVKEILAIDSAADIDKDEYDRLKDKISAGGTITPDELSSLRKYHLQDTFGDNIIKDAKCEHPSGTQLEGIAAMAYLNWGMRLEASLKRYYRFFNRPLDDAINRDLGAERQQEKVGARFPADLRYSTREHKLWQSINFEQFLDPKREWMPWDYKEICDRIKEQHVAVAQVIGTSFEKMSNGQIFTTLLSRLGFETISERIQVNGKRYSMKKIDAASWELSQNFVDYQEQRRLLAEAEVEGRRTTMEPTPFFPIQPITEPKPAPDPAPQSIQLSLFEVPQQKTEVATPPFIIVNAVLKGGGSHVLSDAGDTVNDRVSSGYPPHTLLVNDDFEGGGSHLISFSDDSVIVSGSESEWHSDAEWEYPRPKRHPIFPHAGAKAIATEKSLLGDRTFPVRLVREMAAGLWECIQSGSEMLIYRTVGQLMPEPQLESS